MNVVHKKFLRFFLYFLAMGVVANVSPSVVETIIHTADSNESQERECAAEKDSTEKFTPRSRSSIPSPTKIFRLVARIPVLTQTPSSQSKTSAILLPFKEFLYHNGIGRSLQL